MMFSYTSENMGKMMLDGVERKLFFPSELLRVLTGIIVWMEVASNLFGLKVVEMGETGLGVSEGLARSRGF